MKVFIADDSRIMRERIASALSDNNELEVVGQAENSTQAIEFIPQLKPDAVILDFRMPDGSGIDVLRSIKKESQPPVVMMLTQHSYPEIRKRCLDAGADYFFDKSTEIEKLLDLMGMLNKTSFQGVAV